MVIALVITQSMWQKIAEKVVSCAKLKRKDHQRKDHQRKDHQRKDHQRKDQRRKDHQRKDQRLSQVW